MAGEKRKRGNGKEPMPPDGGGGGRGDSSRAGSSSGATRELTEEEEEELEKLERQKEVLAAKMVDNDGKLSAADAAELERIEQQIKRLTGVLTTEDERPMAQQQFREEAERQAEKARLAKERRIRDLRGRRDANLRIAKEQEEKGRPDLAKIARNRATRLSRELRKLTGERKPPPIPNPPKPDRLYNPLGRPDAKRVANGNPKPEKILKASDRRRQMDEEDEYYEQVEAKRRAGTEKKYPEQYHWIIDAIERASARLRSSVGLSDDDRSNLKRLLNKLKGMLSAISRGNVPNAVNPELLRFIDMQDQDQGEVKTAPPPRSSRRAASQPEAPSGPPAAVEPIVIPSQASYGGSSLSNSTARGGRAKELNVQYISDPGNRLAVERCVIEMVQRLFGDSLDREGVTILDLVVEALFKEGEDQEETDSFYPEFDYSILEVDDGFFQGFIPYLVRLLTKTILDLKDPLDSYDGFDDDEFGGPPIEWNEETVRRLLNESWKSFTKRKKRGGEDEELRLSDDDEWQFIIAILCAAGAIRESINADPERNREFELMLSEVANLFNREFGGLDEETRSSALDSVRRIGDTLNARVRALLQRALDHRNDMTLITASQYRYDPTSNTLRWYDWVNEDSDAVAILVVLSRLIRLPRDTSRTHARVRSFIQSESLGAFVSALALELVERSYDENLYFGLTGDVDAAEEGDSLDEAPLLFSVLMQSLGYSIVRNEHGAAVNNLYLALIEAASRMRERERASASSSSSSADSSGSRFEAAIHGSDPDMTMDERDRIFKEYAQAIRDLVFEQFARWAARNRARVDTDAVVLDLLDQPMEVSDGDDDDEEKEYFTELKPRENYEDGQVPLPVELSSNMIFGNVPPTYFDTILQLLSNFMGIDLTKVAAGEQARIMSTIRSLYQQLVSSSTRSAESTAREDLASRAARVLASLRRNEVAYDAKEKIVDSIVRALAKSLKGRQSQQKQSELGDQGKYLPRNYPNVAREIVERMQNPDARMTPGFTEQRSEIQRVVDDFMWSLSLSYYARLEHLLGSPYPTGDGIVLIALTGIHEILDQFGQSYTRMDPTSMLNALKGLLRTTKEKRNRERRLQVLYAFHKLCYRVFSFRGLRQLAATARSSPSGYDSKFGDVQGEDNFNQKGPKARYMQSQRDKSLRQSTGLVDKRTGKELTQAVDNIPATRSYRIFLRDLQELATQILSLLQGRAARLNAAAAGSSRQGEEAGVLSELQAALGSAQAGDPASLLELFDANNTFYSTLGSMADEEMSMSEEEMEENRRILTLLDLVAQLVSKSNVGDASRGVVPPHLIYDPVGILAHLLEVMSVNPEKKDGWGNMYVDNADSIRPHLRTEFLNMIATIVLTFDEDTLYDMYAAYLSLQQSGGLSQAEETAFATHVASILNANDDVRQALTSIDLEDHIRIPFILSLSDENLTLIRAFLMKIIDRRVVDIGLGARSVADYVEEKVREAVLIQALKRQGAKIKQLREFARDNIADAQAREEFMQMVDYYATPKQDRTEEPASTFTLDQLGMTYQQLLTAKALLGELAPLTQQYADAEIASGGTWDILSTFQDNFMKIFKRYIYFTGSDETRDSQAVKLATGSIVSAAARSRVQALLRHVLVLIEEQTRGDDVFNVQRFFRGLERMDDLTLTSILSELYEDVMEEFRERSVAFDKSRRTG